MPIKPIPLTRWVFVSPFISILNEMGAPTASLLAKFHLPTHLEPKSNHYIPLFPALRFVTATQLSQGIADFGFLAGRKLRFEALNAQFRATVHRSPTLLAALQSFCRFVQLEDNMLHVRLEQHGPSLRVCYSSAIPGAEGMPHFEHAQWLQNMVAILIVRQFAGPQWLPPTFAFQARHVPTKETQSFWPNTRFLSGQNAAWIEIPVSQLSLPVRMRARAPSRSQEQPFCPIGTDVVTALKLMLPSYLGADVPVIAEAAEIVGTSARSLQRELAAADLTYSRLLEQVQFESAAEMLRETDARIIDVAHATGYADPSHFTRAFRRMAGVTPREFREISDPP